MNFEKIFAALRFDQDGSGAPRSVSEDVLRLCDREHLTLPLLYRHAALGPQIEDRLIKNTERVRRITAAFAELAESFSRAGIESAVLKGFSQCPDFVPDLRYRVQYDLDFYCPDSSIYRARDVLLQLGYEPLRQMEEFPTDHLPVMIRKTGWQWCGDFYDPDIPVSIDLHFRFWDESTECFNAPGLDQFWSRMRVRTIGDIQYLGLEAVDALGYHCLHLLRHLLRGSLRLSHVYELAWFLEHQTGDDDFWREWQQAHPERLRCLEVVPCKLAREWFGCRLPLPVLEEIGRLPEPVNRWFDFYAFSPIEKLWVPNKHELFLHTALLESAAQKRRVLRRRLFPLRPPGPVDSVYVPDDQLTLRLRARRRIRYAAHVAERVAHHARVLPSFVWHAAKWSLARNFWTFIAAASLFNLGLFVFFLIYNLHLLDRGFRETFLGVMNGAFTAGSVAGALPAGALLQRFGVSRTVQLCIGGTAIVATLRAFAPGPVPLVGLAFLGGMAFSLWAVTIAPAVAQLTPERNRARAFSVFFAISIAVGVLGGFIGGRMPQWFSALNIVSAKQTTLLSGCVLMLLALLPAARLPLINEHVRSRPKYPFGPFIRRFLLSLAGWNLAVGAFNPFFNLFFARHLSAGTEQIGIVFSAGQIAQVAAMMLAPLILRACGLVNGVMATQMAAGLSLAALASSSTLWAGGIAYAAYAAFQYMTEPGVYTLLMNRVAPEEQSGASSLNFFAAFSAQALAAMVTGAAFARFGYQFVTFIVAVAAIVAAFVFWAMLRRFDRSLTVAAQQLDQNRDR